MIYSTSDNDLMSALFSSLSAFLNRPLWINFSPLKFMPLSILAMTITAANHFVVNLSLY